MDQNVERDPRVMWIFAVSALIVIIGAVAPVALTAGSENRLNIVAIPYVIAAIALAVNAFMYTQGRLIAAALYFIAGLAIVYGILSMLSVPLRLAVAGTCPTSEATCPLGFEHPLTNGETNGLDTATICGILAIFIAFYGLAMVYRRRKPAPTTPARVWPAAPPVTSTTPGPAVTKPAEPEAVAPAEPTPVAAPEPEPVAVADPVPAPQPTPTPARRAPRKKAATPPPPPVEEELKELPAPEELKELPPPA